MNSALVTIVAISYNQERYVIDALNSIKNQTYKNIQLIIADDGSKDNTKQLISGWLKDNWPDALFLNHPVNRGVTKNLNSALPYVKGEFYQFFGCEDFLLPKKIELQVNILINNPDYAIAYSDMYRMDVDGNYFPKTFYTFKDSNVPRTGWVYDYLLERCFISTPSALMRSEVVKSLGGDNEKMGVNDYDFWVRASKKFQFIYHSDVTIEYRVLPTSISARKGIFVYKNGFLLLYYNYDRRKKYKPIFDKKMLTGLQMLTNMKYRKTPILAFKAFLKSGKIKFLLKSIQCSPLLLTGKNN